MIRSPFPADIEQQQQQPHDTRKKNKSRGNRKLQRFRAKLRKRGFNADRITMLINDYQSPKQEEHEDETITSDVDIEALIPLREQVRSIDEKNEEDRKYFLFFAGNSRNPWKTTMLIK